MTTLKKGGFSSLLLLLGFFGYSQLDLKVEKDPSSESYGQISLLGLSLVEEKLSEQQIADFFTIYVAGASRPVLGEYWQDKTSIKFKPRFLPDPQVNYKVVFKSREASRYLTIDEDSHEWIIRFDLLAKERSNAIGFYPNLPTIPANILRFYLHFPQPMGFDNPYRHLSLIDEEGLILKDAFVEVEEGLWSEDQKRLTILLHPGRIKRGVGPNTTQGRIFEPGKSYRLLISKEWKDALGNQASSDFEIRFEISEEVRELIKVEKWILKAPTSATKEVLKIEVDEILDLPLARRMIEVFDSVGNEVDGSFDFDADKLVLSFLPTKHWISGKYIVRVNPKLEDVCGNTPVNVFDLATNGDHAKQRRESTPDLVFEIK